MTEERTTPLRAQMIEDMRIRGLWDKFRQVHIRTVKDPAAFLGRSPDTDTSEELRAYQLHMTDAEVSPSIYNARITALRFFFSMTCGRAEMKRCMQFRTQPRKLPAVLSAEEVSERLAGAPGRGLGDPVLVVSDGAPGIITAIGTCFPRSGHSVTSRTGCATSPPRCPRMSGRR